MLYSEERERETGRRREKKDIQKREGGEREERNKKESPPWVRRRWSSIWLGVEAGAPPGGPEEV